MDIIDLAMGNPDRPTPKHIVDKLIEVSQDGKAHRYSASRGIPALLKAIARYYDRKYGVSLDWEKEVVATIGSKEGIGHLVLALIDPGDLALVPHPAYPIHIYSVALAGGNVVTVPLHEEQDFVPSMAEITREIWPKPRIITLNFPNNPTTATVSLDFFQEVVDYAKKNDIIVIHDMAYSEITFDGYESPSFLQAKGRRTSGWSFSPCPSPTTWQAGESERAWGMPTWSERSQKSRATTTTAFSPRSRWLGLRHWTGHRTAYVKPLLCIRPGGMYCVRG